MDWLLENVDGLRDKKEAKKFATDLLKLKLITQMHANQQTFIEQRYYMVGPECQGTVQLVFCRDERRKTLRTACHKAYK